MTFVMTLPMSAASNDSMMDCVLPGNTSYDHKHDWFCDLLIQNKQTKSMIILNMTVSNRFYLFVM